jgi:hypothetical protein
MVDADTNPPGIRGQIIDAIGHRSAEFLDQEVVHPDLFRIPLRAILAAIIAEIPTGAGSKIARAPARVPAPVGGVPRRGA